MKTLVEASAAFNQGAGIGRYARNILKRVLDSNANDQWTLVWAPEQRDAPVRYIPPDRPGVRTVNLPFNRRRADQLWFRAQIPLDVRLLAGRADAVYSPDFTAPPAFGLPRMITVHDLAFITHPATTTEALRRYLTAVVPRQVEVADRVAVDSFAIRDEVIRLLGVAPERIVVAKCGVEDRFLQAMMPDPAMRERLGLPDRYLLMVGTIEPRKNHVAALKALEIAGLGDRLPLVIAGRPGWGYEEAMAEAKRLAARGFVRILDYVPEDDLPSLYAGATAVLYPSWTEGFGLPVVEALAAGTAAITGTAPVLREVGGPEAWYADPADHEALAALIHRASDTITTDEVRRRRRQWTRQFSWDQSAQTIGNQIRQLKNLTS